MPDSERHDRSTATPQSYRDYASSIHQRAEQACFAESRQTLEDVARCYEVLANHVEGRRKTR
jgi:hypothetical protein